MKNSYQDTADGRRQTGKCPDLAYRLPSTVYGLPFALLLLSSGCSLFPADKSVSFQQHAASRESTSQRIAERRDNAEFMAAHQRWEQQDVAGCREQLEALLARNPQHCEARLLMADVFLSTRQPQAALAQVQEALKYHAESPDVQYAMGLTLDANGRPDEAVAFYERATRATPGNEAYAISYRTACESARRRQSPAAAAQPLQSAPPTGARSAGLAPDIQPPSPVITPPTVTTASFDNTAGVAYAEPDDRIVGPPPAGTQYSAAPPMPAASTVRIAVEDEPHDPQIPVTAATDALKHHNARAAVDILTPATRQFPDSPAVFRSLGIAHLETGDFSAAQKDLERSLSLDKSSALSYFLMGCTMTKLGQHEAAEANFRQAGALDPRYAVRP